MVTQIIWDWNGTLWNDTWLCVEINNHMLARRNLPPITIETYQDKLCFPVTDYYCQLGFDYQVDPYRQLAEEFIAEYETRRFECELQHGARDLIAFLQTVNIPQAVLSAYEQEALREATDYFQLTEYFDDIIGLNDIYAAGKVENGKQYISESDTDPNDVLFIGDTIHDFEVAQAMGVHCVLMTGGHNSRHRLESCEVPVFDTLYELQNHIQKM